MPRNGRKTTVFVFTATAIVVLTGTFVRRPLVREWTTWRFEREGTTGKQRLAARLVELGGQKVVSAWFRSRFHESDEETRDTVAREAAAVGMPALANELFLEEIYVDSMERQEAAFEWLSANGDVETARKLLSLLHSLIETESDVARSDNASIEFVYSTIAHIAQRHQKATVPLLVDMIESPTSRPGEDYQVRICATLLLASLGPAASDAIPTLRTMLEDEDEKFRTTVQSAIAQISS